MENLIAPATNDATVLGESMPGQEWDGLRVTARPLTDDPVMFVGKAYDLELTVSNSKSVDRTGYVVVFIRMGDEHNTPSAIRVTVPSNGSVRVLHKDCRASEAGTFDLRVVLQERVGEFEANATQDPALLPGTLMNGGWKDSTAYSGPVRYPKEFEFEATLRAEERTWRDVTRKTGSLQTRLLIAAALIAAASLAILVWPYIHSYV
jgi:hypothetical protein